MMVNKTDEKAVVYLEEVFRILAKRIAPDYTVIAWALQDTYKMGREAGIAVALNRYTLDSCEEWQYEQ